MGKITIKNGKEFNNGRHVVAAMKKIKVSSEKLAKIEEMRDKSLSVAELNPVGLDKLDAAPESPAVEERIKVDFPEIEEPVVAEEVVPKVEPIVEKKVEVAEEPMEFAFKISDNAYHAKETGDEISKAQEDQIRGLGNAYKGVKPNSELRKVMEEAPKGKEIDSISEDDVYELTNRKYYRPKANRYASEQGKKLSQYDSYIDAKNKEVSEYQKQYNEVNAKIATFKETINLCKTFMEKTNKSDLVNFIADHKERYGSLLNVIKTCFDEDGSEIISTNNSINSLEADKRDLSDKEKAAKEEIMDLRRQRDEFLVVAYRNLKKLAELDTEIRKGEEGLSDVTGIMGEEVSLESQRETVTNISSMETPAMNRFESLREPISEEPKTVIGVNQFMNGESYDDMSFGRRVA